MQGRATVIFEAVGSRGDVAPVLGLAAESSRRGHDTLVLGPERFEQEAQTSGLRYLPVSDWQAHRHGPDAFSFGHYVFPGLPRTTAYFQRREAPTLVVNVDRLAASNLCCERLGIPVLRLHLSPFRIRSLASPPWPFRRQAGGPLGRVYREFTLPKLYEALDRDPGLVAHINEQRRSLELDAIERISQLDRPVRRQICMFPDWYCAPAEDWSPATELVGFPLPASRGPLPEAVQRFIECQGAPLVFTTGTGVSAVDAFFASARACCEELGRAGIILGADLARAVTRAGDRILQLDYVDLPPLLKHARLLVHHGGVGTTARALEAGVPQIVSPLGFDTPDNAQRVLELGVARVIERAALSGRALAVATQQLEADAGLAERLATLRRRLVGSDGLERCADILDREIATIRSAP